MEIESCVSTCRDRQPTMSNGFLLVIIRYAMTPFLIKEIPVLSSMLDDNGHVNNLVFMHWMQDVAIEHARQAGCTDELYRRLGVSWVAKSHYIEYANSAWPDDIVLARTWIADARKVSCRRLYQFHRKTAAGELLAAAETVWVFIDSQTGRPRRILPEVLECFDLLGDQPPGSVP